MTKNLNLKARLEIPPVQIFQESAVQFVLSYAKSYSVQTDKLEHLKNAFQAAISMVIENNARDHLGKPIVVETSESEGKLIVELLNHGVPILSATETSSSAVNGLSFKFQEASKNIDKISIENLGRRGQTVILEMKLGQGAIEKSLSPATLVREKITVKSEDIVIRPLQPGEETALSQLFYFVYGYNYINEYIYYPEKIKMMLQEKKLISIVAALPNKRLLGHVGLVKWKDSPAVYEAALGVVDPAVKLRGLFGKMFQKTFEKIQETPMQYSFFDFVTNHDYSQNLIAKYGTHDMAIFIGCQSKETQADMEKLGLGPEPKDMNRYTLLFSIIAKAQHPFGKEVLLPENFGRPLGFLLKPLGLSWIPTPRFHPLGQEGQYKAHYQPTQNSVTFDLFNPGRKAVEDILKDWRKLLRDGYQYAAIEFPLSAPGCGQLYDLLAKEGFFISGFIPYHLTDQLGFRFQAIAPAKVAFDQIKVASEHGKKLLEIIKKDYERNRLI